MIKVVNRFDAWLSITAIVFSVIMISVFVYDHINVYAPLKHPIPENVTREPATFHLSELGPGVVISQSLFFNSERVSLTASVVAKWIMVEPKRSLKEEPAEIIFTTSIEPGCSVGRFVNIIPDDVKQITKEQFEAGHDKVVWRLQGSNTITQPKSAPDPVPFYLEDITFLPENINLPEYKVEDTPVCPRGNK